MIIKMWAKNSKKSSQIIDDYIKIMIENNYNEADVYNKRIQSSRSSLQ